MNAFVPMFACGPGFSPAVEFLILSVVALWMLSALLTLPNLYLFVFVKRSRSFELTHGALFLAYVLPMIASVSGLTWPFGSTGPVVWTVAAFGLPICAISHFVYLSLAYRRLRPKKTKAIEPQRDNYQGPRCVACSAPIQPVLRICSSCGWTQPEYDRL